MFDTRDYEMTAQMLADPQVGDRFTEMYSFWLYIIGRSGEWVTTMEGSPPCTFPQDGIVRTQTVEELHKRLAYGSIPGFWMEAAGRGHDVRGWAGEEYGYA